MLLGSVPQLGLLEVVQINIREEQMDNRCYRDDHNSPDLCLDALERCRMDMDVDVHNDELDLLTTEWLGRALLAFEQLLVVLLVLGRWFLPRGGLTREKLSDMLFTFVGMGLDILEFLQTGLTVDEIACNAGQSIVVLGISALSLFQFTIDLDLFIGFYHTKKRMQKRKMGDSNSGTCCSSNPEVRTILMNMFLQDAPFLGFRLYLITTFEHDIDDQQSLIFFMIKNVLVLALQSYRLWIVLRNVSISSRKLERMIDNAEMTEFHLDEDFAIGYHDDELVVTLDQPPLDVHPIPKTILTAMIKEHTGNFSVNEDIKLKKGDYNIILSLREKTENDKIKKNMRGQDNEAVRWTEQGL
ncbi:uncharacterized protein [Amphiura filiformis]|uniref:uncharacterized protein n=1 Tax=Amphiura filiformis TaxID=82378 RepID=UPI003B211CAF